MKCTHYLWFKPSEEAKNCPNNYSLPWNSFPYTDIKKGTEFSSGYYSQGESECCDSPESLLK